MDPCLEQPDLWPEVHSRLLVAIADYLGPQLRPKYRVAIEKRVYEDTIGNLPVGCPDVSVLKRTSAPLPSARLSWSRSSLNCPCPKRFRSVI
ncbi:MAG: DUF4058 family protein [Thermosynechococcaceae cyanobacterium]